MEYKKKVFKNGLTVITVPLDNPTVTVFVGAKTGSKYEDARTSGLSHFLEHMCFKGTPTRPTAKAISEELDVIGAINNAFTSQEYTCYYAKADKRHFDIIVDVVSDIYQNPVIPAKELEKERGVILQEYKMYLDELKWRVSDLWMDLLYGDSPAGWRIVGNPQTIATLSRKDFLTYHKTHYTAGNTVVVVAGNIQSSIVERRIKRLFENISTLPAKKKKPVVESQDTPRIALEYKDSDQTHIILGVRSFPSSDRRTKVMRVLQSVLSGGMSSRLFQKMREDLGICYYVSAGNDTYTDHGNFSVSAGVDTERLPIAITAILEELVLLKKELVSPQELHKVKEGIIGRLSLSLESSDDIGGFILGRVMAGVPIETPEEIIASVQSVSAEEVQQLAREIFIDATLNLAIVGKHKNKKELLKLLTFNT